MTAMIAGGIWFFLFAATLGFDPPPVIRLVRRWAGALCLCVFPLFLVPVAGRWFLLMLDIALLPLVGAVGLTLKYRHARQSQALEAVEPRHN